MVKDTKDKSAQSTPGGTGQVLYSIESNDENIKAPHNDNEGRELYSVGSMIVHVAKKS